MYAVIQSPAATAINSNLWAVIELFNDAYVSPAGYVVGEWRVVKDSIKHKLVADTLSKELNKGA